MDWSKIAAWNWTMIGGIAGVLALIAVPIMLLAWRFPREPRKAKGPEERAYTERTRLPEPEQASSLPADRFQTWAEDDESLVSWLMVYDPYVTRVSAFGYLDFIMIGDKEFYPWSEDQGQEPPAHRALRNKWLVVLERCKRNGLLERTGKETYRLSGSGLELAMKVGERPLPPPFVG